MLSSHYDLITVGGGMAASALAKCLAESGAKVLVLEQETRFRDRIRGEFIMPWGVAEIAALGIYELLCKACAQEVPWIDMGMGGPPRELTTTTAHQKPGLGYSHPEMQETLLTAAERAGSEVRRGVTVQGVEPGTPAVVIAASGKNSERISARLVVGADGRSSQTRKWAGFELTKDSHPFLLCGIVVKGVATKGDIAFVQYNPELGTVCTIFPQTKGRSRVYLGYPSTMNYRLQGGGDVKLLFSEFARTAPGLAPFLSGAECIGPLASFDANDVWVEHPYRNGVALIGDAAATSDPSAGQGMAISFRDARVMRDHLLASPDWDKAAHAYASEHDGYFAKCHAATVWQRQVFQEQTPEARLRRQKAMPLIAEDPTRVPDYLFSGPDLPMDDGVRARFFGEV
jgi:2-polyprenyl-6-methoxyphenol hydroxylase-like FAD-dependent oxidoreductase